jgi:hypothetical protein
MFPSPDFLKDAQEDEGLPKRLLIETGTAVSDPRQRP